MYFIRPIHCEVANGGASRTSVCGGRRSTLESAPIYHPAKKDAHLAVGAGASAKWASFFAQTRRRILPPRRARPVAAQLVGARVDRISTCATCGETRPTLRTGRALAHLCSCVCGCSSRAVCVGLAPLRGFQCKNLAVGQHHTERERRLSSDAPEPASHRSGPGRMETGG